MVTDNMLISVYLGCAMRKHVLEHMQTVKAQISLRIRAVWSEPSLSANRIIDWILQNVRMESKGLMYFAHVQDDLNLHILGMFKGTFSLHATHMYNDALALETFLHDIMFLTSDHEVKGWIPLEIEFCSWLKGASLNRAFHYHTSIFSLWLKYI